jgi:hypothetical protein
VAAPLLSSQDVDEGGRGEIRNSTSTAGVIDIGNWKKSSITNVLKILDTLVLGSRVNIKINFFLRWNFSNVVAYTGGAP